MAKRPNIQVWRSTFESTVSVTQWEEIVSACVIQLQTARDAACRQMNSDDETSVGCIFEWWASHANPKDLPGGDQLADVFAEMKCTLGSLAHDSTNTSQSNLQDFIKKRITPNMLFRALSLVARLDRAITTQRIYSFSSTQEARGRFWMTESNSMTTRLSAGIREGFDLAREMILIQCGTIDDFYARLCEAAPTISAKMAPFLASALPDWAGFVDHD